MDGRRRQNTAEGKKTGVKTRLICGPFWRATRNIEREMCMDTAATLSAVQIGVPLYMVLFYIAIISVCLLLGRTQLGLAVSFLFVFYLGYFHNRALFLDVVRGSTVSSVIYTGLGFVLIILALISFLFPPKQRK